MILKQFLDIQEFIYSHAMAQGSFTSEIRVNTPGKEASKLNHSFDASSFESDLSAPLSPPQTVDTKQKRERSKSLMISQTNDMLATKRRLRSRSRLGLGPEDIPSAFMSPPCTSKPRERTQSKIQNLSEQLFCHPEEFSKHMALNPESSTVYMTPLSEPREPLQNKDVNTLNATDPENFASFEEGRLSAHLDYPSDSSTSDDEIISYLEEKTRTKLNFDQYADQDGLQTKSKVKPAITPEHCKIIGTLIGQEKIDFIKELVNMNCEEICKQIFSNLEPRDLQR